MEEEKGFRKLLMHIFPSKSRHNSPKTTGKKIKKILYQALREKTIFAITNKEIQCTFFNCLRIVTKTEILFSKPVVIFYVLYNNFFYFQLFFIFNLWKDFCIVHIPTNTFVFLLQKNSYIAHKHIFL